jgi:hypothetical protein
VGAGRESGPGGVGTDAGERPQPSRFGIDIAPWLARFRNDVPAARPEAAPKDVHFYVQCFEVRTDATRALGERPCKELGYRPAVDALRIRR